MQAVVHAIARPPDKRAILVSSNVQYQAGRMAELLDPKGLKVFRDEEAAVKWLLEITPVEKPLKFDRSRSSRITIVRKQ